LELKKVTYFFVRITNPTLRTLPLKKCFDDLLDSTSENAMQVVQPLSVVNVGKPLGIVDHGKAENEKMLNFG